MQATDKQIDNVHRWILIFLGKGHELEKDKPGFKCIKCGIDMADWKKGKQWQEQLGWCIDLDESEESIKEIEESSEFQELMANAQQKV
jgi:peptide subunit release factor 1 (eRF1)